MQHNTVELVKLNLSYLVSENEMNQEQILRERERELGRENKKGEERERWEGSKREREMLRPIASLSNKNHNFDFQEAIFKTQQDLLEGNAGSELVALKHD